MGIAPFPPVYDTLGANADLTPSPARKLSLYWHGTTVDKLEGILKNGLSPDETLFMDHVCLATKAHVAHFYARIHTLLSDGRGETVLIRIPGTQLLETRFFIETGALKNSAYGHDMKGRDTPTLRTLETWKDFQAVTDTVGYLDTIPVDETMLDWRCQDVENTHMTSRCTSTLLEEYATGIPTFGAKPLAAAA